MPNYISNSTPTPIAAQPVVAYLMARDGTNWNMVDSHRFQSTSDITSSGPGTALTLSPSPKADFSLQVVRTGGTGSFTVSLERSLDGTNFTSSTNSSTHLEMVHETGKLSMFARYNVLAIAASTTLSVYLLAG